MCDARYCTAPDNGRESKPRKTQKARIMTPCKLFYTGSSKYRNLPPDRLPRLRVQYLWDKAVKVIGSWRCGYEWCTRVLRRTNSTFDTTFPVTCWGKSIHQYRALLQCDFSGDWFSLKPCNTWFVQPLFLWNNYCSLKVAWRQYTLSVCISDTSCVGVGLKTSPNYTVPRIIH